MNPEMSQNCLPQEMLARPAVLLGRLGTAMKAESMERFEAAGFSVYHYGVLAVLDEGERETQATIADALAVDRSMLVGLLDQLEDRGMVERRRDPNDRRRQMVKLTPAGRRQLTEFRKMVEEIENEFLAALDEEERRTLHDLLLRVAAHRDVRFAPTQTAVSQA
jgi:MarR family transcriptional regulator, lower aerobic nicotinate degradation pathway regulator